MGISLIGVANRALTPHHPPPPIPCSLPPSRRPSGIPEKDLCSTLVPYFLQQRDALRRRVQKQEAENRQLADAVLAGRRQVEELQLQGQAQWQAWQVSALALPQLSKQTERGQRMRGTLWGPYWRWVLLWKSPA